MKILENLPKHYSYNFSLEKLDNEAMSARVMVDIFKELNKRIEKDSNKCPWCTHELS